MSAGAASSSVMVKGCCVPGAWCPSDSLANASKIREVGTSLRLPAWIVENNVEAVPMVFASEFWIKVIRVLVECVYTSETAMRIGINVKMNHKYHEAQSFLCQFKALMRIKIGNDICRYGEIITLTYFPSRWASKMQKIARTWDNKGAIRCLITSIGKHLG